MDAALIARWETRPRTEEPEWLSACRTGEAWALERFYGSHHGRVYALCFRITGSEDDAQDAMQTTFIRAFRDLPRFRGDCAVTTWLYRIAVNEALALVRKRRPSTPEPLEEAAARDPEVVEQLAVRAALRQVSPDHRVVLVLRFWQELSVEEIAEVLRVSPSAVKMRLMRARQEFRRHYEEAR